MRILRKLLDNLGGLWNTLPKEVPLFTIAKGTGTHSRVTVDNGVVYFHSVTYRKGLPQCQEIALDELTASEFVTIVSGLGYDISYTSEAVSHGLDVHKPFVMIEESDKELPATTLAFTSNLWQVMYPIYRILRDTEFDTSEAIKEWYRPLADGEWLDFWADFFNIKRSPSEDDNSFSRRFTTWLFNPKTNNVALEELLSYRLQDNDIEVRDRAPLQFELVVGTKYIADASDLHRILQETKGAGIEYFLNYQSGTMEEQYPAYWTDKHGKPFTQLDGGSPFWMLSKPFSEIMYTRPTEDSFGRTGALSGSTTDRGNKTWVGVVGALATDGGKAYATSYTSGAALATFEAASADYEYTTVVRVGQDQSNIAGVPAFRCQDSNNYFFLRIPSVAGSPAAVSMFRKSGASTIVYPTVGTVPNTALTPGNTYTIRVSDVARRIRVYIDNTLVYDRPNTLELTSARGLGLYTVEPWAGYPDPIKPEFYDITASYIGDVRESAGHLLRKLHEELYEVPPPSTLSSVMTVNESQLLMADLIVPTPEPQQDTAYITLTVGGLVVNSRVV